MSAPPSPSPSRPAARFLSATEVARICDVDLKTIHNWADRGKIPCWRTPGRHLRFRRVDVVDFLRAYAFDVPDALRHARPRVVAIDTDRELLETMQRAVGRRFDVLTYADVVPPLLALADSEADALVLGDCAPLDPEALIVAVRASPGTGHVRTVAMGAQAPSASAWVPRGNLAALREALERVTGL